MRSRSVRWPLLLVAALTAGAAFAACSSSTKATGHADEHDASLDADEDGSNDVVTAPEDVVVYPDVKLPVPDGCALVAATCLDDTMCCSDNCVDGGCALTIKQQ